MPKRKLKSSTLLMEAHQIGVAKDSQRTIPKPPKQEMGRSTKKLKVEIPPQFTTEIVERDDNIDDFLYTPISNKGNSNTTAISVESYDEERNLDLAIIASLRSYRSNFVDLSQDFGDFFYFDGIDDYGDHDDDLRVLKFRPLPTTITTTTKKEQKSKNLFANSTTKKGQSSKSNNDPEFVCEICVEPMTANESFSIKGCSHSYCKGCMAKYVASKLQENITNIHCPVSGCAGLLEPEYCRSILPQEVFDRWGDALCEALIIGSQKFYCPFKDCSAMLINDGEEVIKESECPNCWRLFCAQCKVPWHSGIDCKKFQTLHKDEREKEDIMLMKLAENKHWRRCPKCRFYVERTQGCRYMKCRCGAAFCYGCGSTQISTRYHYCNSCLG